MINAYRIQQALETGLGAVRLGDHVKSIKLTYPRKGALAAGPHRFFKNYMPKLKFNNPELDMKVVFLKEAAPSTLEIQLNTGKTSTINVTKLKGDSIVFKLLETLAAKA